MIVDYKHAEVLSPSNSAILKDVNFEAGEGDFIFITGRVGSGKSSFLKSLYAHYPVAGDKAEVLGFDLLKLKHSRTPDLRQQLGIVFQDFQLLPDRTVFTNLDFVLRATGNKKKEERRKRIAEVLEAVSLTDKADKFPHELSGGEQQRTAIARAILNHPKIIIADEPTGNLDQESEQRLMDILKELQSQGTTIIMSTHNMRLISQVDSAVIYTCDDGTLKPAGPSEPISPADPPASEQ